jgi:hypothetical protein
MTAHFIHVYDIKKNSHIVNVKHVVEFIEAQLPSENSLLILMNGEKIAVASGQATKAIVSAFENYKP